MRAIQCLLVVALPFCFIGHALADEPAGQGLKRVLPGERPGERRGDWQAERQWGRLSLSGPGSQIWPGGSTSASRLVSTTLPNSAIAASYYFKPSPGSARPFGFRATGGLGANRAGSNWMGSLSQGIGQRAGADGRDGAVFPYLSVGYSGIYPKSGWGFTADVGLAGFTPTHDATDTRSLGRGLDPSRTMSQQGVDMLFRQLRLRPLIQLGVSYSF